MRSLSVRAFAAGRRLDHVGKRVGTMPTALRVSERAVRAVCGPVITWVCQTDRLSSKVMPATVRLRSRGAIRATLAGPPVGRHRKGGANAGAQAAHHRCG